MAPTFSLIKLTFYTIYTISVYKNIYNTLTALLIIAQTKRHNSTWYCGAASKSYCSECSQIYMNLVTIKNRGKKNIFYIIRERKMISIRKMRSTLSVLSQFFSLISSFIPLCRCLILKRYFCDTRRKKRKIKKNK